MTSTQWKTTWFKKNELTNDCLSLDNLLWPKRIISTTKICHLTQSCNIIPWKKHRGRFTTTPTPIYNDKNAIIIVTTSTRTKNRWNIGTKIQPLHITSKHQQLFFTNKPTSTEQNLDFSQCTMHLNEKNTPLAYFKPLFRHFNGKMDNLYVRAYGNA